MTDPTASQIPSAPTAIRGGLVRALLAAVLFGASAPLAKGLLRDVRPQMLAGLLYLGSGLGLLAVWLARRGGTSAEAPLTRRDAPWLAGAITAGGVLGPLLLMVGLSRTPASRASLFLNPEDVFTALLAWFVFKENFDRRIALGMVGIVAGGALVSWTGRAELGGSIGPLAVAGACLCWAVDNNLTQKVSAGDPVQITTLKGLTAGAVNTGISFALGSHLPAAWRVAGIHGARLRLLRAEPRALRARAAGPGHRAHRCLLLDGAVRGRGAVAHRLA